MVKKQGKNIISRLLFSPVVLAVIGLIIIILISFPLAKNISQRYKINQEMRSLEAEIARLEDQNINFKGLITYLESDQFVEEQARLDLNLKKEGEEVAIIKTENPLDQEEREAAGDYSSDIKTAGETSGQISNFKRWWQYFFGLNS